MKTIYTATERTFEHLSTLALRVFGSSITFLVALAVIIYWMSLHEFSTERKEDICRDIILSITFLSFFIIQKQFNRFSAALHIKLNELVKSHEEASNSIVGIEEKSEEEIRELAKTYKGEK